jgi:sucrose-6-phosphate hydrolase SacC (GH32 family)
LVYYAGEYHLFYQHNPTGIDWGNMHWGHAISADLVHWRELPIALAPDEFGTMFSGSAVVDWKNSAGFGVGDEPALVAVYTTAGGSSPESQGKPFTQCLAYSNDRGRTWIKYKGNPVLDQIVGGNRDPKAIWCDESSSWLLCLYLDGDEFALFTSPDLKEWARIQTIRLPNSMECPDFFPMTVQGDPEARYWVLTAADGQYLVGEFDGRQFTALQEAGRLDWGANYYAVQTYSDIPDSDGRRIQVGWMRDGRYPEMPFNQQMAFPSELTLHRTQDGLRLRRMPVAEIGLLRKPALSLANVTVSAARNPLSALSGDAIEIKCEIETADGAGWELSVRGEAIRFSPDNCALECLGRTAVVKPISGKIKLTVLVDRASIEIFANDGDVSMSFCYTPSADNRSYALRAVSTPVAVTALEVNDLCSSWIGGVCD